MDPITQFFAGIAAAMAKAVMAELIADLPLLLTQLRTVNTSTMTDAPAAPPDLVAALNKEIADAGKP